MIPENQDETWVKPPKSSKIIVRVKNTGSSLKSPKIILASQITSKHTFLNNIHWSNSSWWWLMAWEIIGMLSYDVSWSFPLINGHIWPYNPHECCISQPTMFFLLRNSPGFFSRFFRGWSRCIDEAPARMDLEGLKLVGGWARSNIVILYECYTNNV